MEFSCDELIGCPTKKRKTQKRRRDSSEVEAEMMGTVVVSDAPASLESVTEEVPGQPAMEPKVGNPTKKIEVAPPTPMDIEVVEIALEITPLTLPTITKEGKVQPIDLLILLLPA